MDRLYLLDRGFPFFAIISATEAVELYSSAPPDRRVGEPAEGFNYWITAENGHGRSFRLITRVVPIPPENLPELCRQLGRLVILPEGLPTCP